MSRRKVFALLTVGVLTTMLTSAQTEEEIEEAIRVFHRGKTFHQEQRYEEAIYEYRLALKLDRENPFLYNAIGLALAALCRKRRVRRDRSRCRFRVRPLPGCRCREPG